MDEEEKLRILVIIEKLLENSIGRSSRLERIKSELENGLQTITDEDKNFVLDKWKKYNEIDSIKKPKPIYKKPKPIYKNLMFLILSSILGLTVLVGISVAIESENSQPGTPFEEEWKDMVIGKDKIDPDLFLTEKENTANTFSDTENSFLAKFGKLENSREGVILEFSSEKTIDNEPWQLYDVIRIESDSSRTKVGSMIFSTQDDFVDTITFKITHNFDTDVMGIALLLFENIGKEYVYLWSDKACFDEKYDDKCFGDGNNNKHMHFLNGGADGLTWKERSDIISGVDVVVEREFKEYFSATFHFIG